MDDTNAFEQQLAAELGRMAGPGRRIDGMAMVRTISAPSSRWGFQSLFSAMKFVVAGAIVALFGGFLLAGVLTLQPSDEPLPVGASASAATETEPTETEPTENATREPEPAATAEADTSTIASDLLSGVDLVTEEVEPGVYRVLSDGVHEPTYVYEPSVPHNERVHANIVAGYDGSVWILDEDRFYRLGDSDTHPATVQTRLDPLSAPRPYVGTDGTLWAMAGPWWVVPRAELGLLYAFADGEWQTRHEGVKQFAVQPDGTVWAIRNPEVEPGADEEPTIERLDPDGWTIFEGGPESEVVDFWVGPGSQATVDRDDDPGMVADYIVKRVPYGDGPPVFEGSAPLWEALRDDIWYLDVGAGGDAWAYLEREVLLTGTGERTEIVPYLIQGTLDTGVSWTYGPEDGVPFAADMVEGRDSIVRTGPDGRLWMVPRGPDYACDGIASFDGTTWTHHLRDTCPVAIDISSDGSAWVRASAQPRDEVHTYVITPEGVAAGADTASAANDGPGSPGTTS